MNHILFLFQLKKIELSCPPSLESIHNIHLTLPLSLSLSMTLAVYIASVHNAMENACIIL